MATAMNVYFTLDYELFLGEKTGTPENCLIRTMDELCKVADKHHFKYVIFVDATYLLRMQQLKGRYKEVDRQFDLVSNHVKSLAEQGHDIELHFHPQWLYSDWDDKAQQWRMDRDHYKLSDMPLADAKKYLREAKELLDGIVGYKTIAYRAGGFCLNEFEDFKEIFKELGLKVDSSVARYSHISSKVHYYDYRRIPKEQIYTFSNSIKEKDDKGEFTEYSITGFKFTPWNYQTKIRPIKLSSNKSQSYGDGKVISDKQNIIVHKIKNLFRLFAQLASIDGGSSNLMEIYYDKAVNSGYTDLIMIGHPKNTTDLELERIDSFLCCHRDTVVKTIRGFVSE